MSGGRRSWWSGRWRSTRCARRTARRSRRWAARRRTSRCRPRHFAPVRVVAVVGEDFPREHRALLRGPRRGPRRGSRRRPGRTFRWRGEYGPELAHAHTLETQLNVFATFHPRLEAQHRACPYVFLANIDPELQLEVLAADGAAAADAERHDELLDRAQARPGARGAAARGRGAAQRGGGARAGRGEPAGAGGRPAARAGREAPSSSRRASTAPCTAPPTTASSRRPSRWTRSATRPGPATRSPADSSAGWRAAAAWTAGCCRRRWPAGRPWPRWPSRTSARGALAEAGRDEIARRVALLHRMVHFDLEPLLRLTRARRRTRVDGCVVRAARACARMAARSEGPGRGA